MVKIILPERDFGYELQALVASFFPGQQIQAEVYGEEHSNAKEDKEPLATINIKWSQYKISADFQAKSFLISRQSFVTGDGDWHKHIDKSPHPYRTYYKNVLKKLVFCLIKDFPEEMLPEGLIRCIPAWGTMTGVRPVKIVMDEILKDKDIASIRESLDSVYCLDSEKAELAIQVATCEAELLKKADYGSGYSLYIGIPFCPTTCLYCSFASNPYYTELADAYLEALFKEMEYSSDIFKDRKLASVYIGGGTPTALNARQLSNLMEALHRYFPLDKSVEFTVEAGRPDSITEEKLKVLYRHGTGRISVNPQTMQQKTLDIIGRRHTARQTADAFNLARKNGFDNINMDLITGLPGETAEDFKNTLSQIRELAPDSLTIHSLVVKRASKLREKIQEDGKEDGSRAMYMEEMFNLGQQFAREQGYHPYYMYRQKNSAGCTGSAGQENIGYAKEGKECLYNILIMEEVQTIAACGAGASTKIYDDGIKQVRRIENVKDVTQYIERIGEMIERKRVLFND